MTLATNIRVLDDDAALVALAEAAKAASAWYSPTPDRAKALPQVLRAWAFVAHANSGRMPARRASDFLALLEAPVKTWLPVSSEQALCQSKCVSEYCLDLLAESGPDPEAELVQTRIGEARARFAQRQDGDAEYTQFRQFLIDHAYCRRTDALKALMPAGVLLSDIYEEIPASRRFLLREEECCWLCPLCRWPMVIRSRFVECASDTCQHEGARYALTEDTVLTPLGPCDAPQPCSIRDGLSLRRGVWRYTVLPGLVELQLAIRLRKLGPVSVRMWPQRDRYDLHVEARTHVWRVDVKDWSSGAALAARLRQLQPEEKTYIIVPDRRKQQVSVLRERVTSPNWDFASVSEFVRRVRSTIGRARAAS